MNEAADDPLPLPPDASERVPEAGLEAAQLGQYIPLHYHGQMLADARRMSAFAEAIGKLVPKGAHVVDLGGGTGVLSFFAAQRARKVTCVERLPHVAEAARRLLHLNGVADVVTVVEADATRFLPDEPADVVLCEMLHAALLREKQIDVLADFKARHRARFDKTIPLIIPEATILAAQPIYQPYDFHGYHAPVPLFFEAGGLSHGTVELGPPCVYAIVEYAADIPRAFAVERRSVANTTGTLNALRFVTKNVVGIFPSEGRSTDWHMLYLSLPLSQPVDVRAGDELKLSFEYVAGGSIESLVASMRAEVRSI